MFDDIDLFLSKNRKMLQYEIQNRKKLYKFKAVDSYYKTLAVKAICLFAAELAIILAKFNDSEIVILQRLKPEYQDKFYQIANFYKFNNIIFEYI